MTCPVKCFSLRNILLAIIFYSGRSNRIILFYSSPASFFQNVFEKIFKYASGHGWSYDTAIYLE
ncbi:MAG: hypothetical protein B6D37_14465 [Sphingobacteriales bacterium UTBCD1]|nr:MAG: hypothetical protein B6D37_14465 [Sphingobacteriales bacterium UTBCD1]